MLSMLIAARDEDGSALDEDDLIGHTGVIFAAGHETSTNALAWTLLLLSQHPDVARDLGDELCGLLRGAPRRSTISARLPLLDAVVKESMRLFRRSPSSRASSRGLGARRAPASRRQRDVPQHLPHAPRSRRLRRTRRASARGAGRPPSRASTSTTRSARVRACASARRSRRWRSRSCSRCCSSASGWSCRRRVARRSARRDHDGAARRPRDAAARSERPCSGAGRRTGSCAQARAAAVVTDHGRAWRTAEACRGSIRWREDRSAASWRMSATPVDGMPLAAAVAGVTTVNGQNW